MANFDIYAAITDRIIAELENGIIPWHKPWTGTTTGAISRETGRPYSLLNQMLLGTPGEYLTWNQVKKEGGSVKKGAKAKMVVFWKVYPREKKNADGRKSERIAQRQPERAGIPKIPVVGKPRKAPAFGGHGVIDAQGQRAEKYK